MLLLRRIQMRRSVMHSMLTVCAVMTLFGTFGSGSTAQELVDATHPSHIHRGTCADLDPNPEYPLSDVGPVLPEAEPGSIEVGITSLDVSLDALLAEPFAINLHESTENVENYIACGDIVGTPVDGMLAVGLNELDDSGYSGVAVLSTTGTGGTDAAVYLGFGLSQDAAANGATPAAASAAPEETAVAILDYSFEASTVEIPVGTTVTWTNDGGVIHTTTSTDGLWDSGIMSSGDVFSHTFDEAGSFTYICTLHPIMIGTIVVTEP